MAILQYYLNLDNFTNKDSSVDFTKIPSHLLKLYENDEVRYKKISDFFDSEHVQIEIVKGGSVVSFIDYGHKKTWLPRIQNPDRRNAFLVILRSDEDIEE